MSSERECTCPPAVRDPNGMRLSAGWDSDCPIHGDPTPANNQELIPAEDNEMSESETSVEDLSRTLYALIRVEWR